MPFSYVDLDLIALTFSCLPAADGMKHLRFWECVFLSPAPRSSRLLAFFELVTFSSVPGVSLLKPSPFLWSKTAMNNMSVPHSVIHSSNFTNPDEADDGGRKKDSGDVPKPKVSEVKNEGIIGRKPKSANPRNDLLK